MSAILRPARRAEPSIASSVRPRHPTSCLSGPDAERRRAGQGRSAVSRPRASPLAPPASRKRRAWRHTALRPLAQSRCAPLCVLCGLALALGANWQVGADAAVHIRGASEVEMAWVGARSLCAHGGASGLCRDDTRGDGQRCRGLARPGRVGLILAGVRASPRSVRTGRAVEMARWCACGLAVLRNSGSSHGDGHLHICPRSERQAISLLEMTHRRDRDPAPPTEAVFVPLPCRDASGAAIVHPAVK
ncbi:hypothetical protein PsYK624_061360 [Phanerochaete sordida]|uniref:Uncharacterized protein n=1 Tax=Phanerochaete sordida TaxID=48140 RepID=A0A9P3G9R0_9APHY|nr:hypothetical protein PsYK624_061360 [Phanerochaete sordida]